MNGKVKCDWLTAIPLLFWLLCIGCGIGKLAQEDKEMTWMGVLNEINVNTFATYISMVICMSYQFFSAKGSRKEEKSGLSRKWIPLTIILSTLYGIVFIINTCRYNAVTTIIMFAYSGVYVLLYFRLMRIKRV